MMKFMLIPKNGKGARWYVKREDLHNGRLVKVTSKDGFETIVDLDNYIIVG